MTPFERVVWLHFASGPKRVDGLEGEMYMPAVRLALASLVQAGFMFRVATDYGHATWCESLIPSSPQPSRGADLPRQTEEAKS